MASPKPGVGLLLMGKPKGEPDADEGGDMKAARLDAMKAFIAAVAKGDANRALEAMDAYHECEPGEPDGDEY